MDLTKNYELFKKTKFNQCQAHEEIRENIDNTITIFRSYTTPKLVRINHGQWYQFTYENSRKAGSITSSKTTSKQITKYLGTPCTEWKKYPKINLKEFEKQYFSLK